MRLAVEGTPRMEPTKLPPRPPQRWGSLSQERWLTHRGIQRYRQSCSNVASPSLKSALLPYCCRISLVGSVPRLTGKNAELDRSILGKDARMRHEPTDIWTFAICPVPVRTFPDARRNFPVILRRELGYQVFEFLT
jgi:hypothetical protein